MYTVSTANIMIVSILVWTDNTVAYWANFSHEIPVFLDHPSSDMFYTKTSYQTGIPYNQNINIIHVAYNSYRNNTWRVGNIILNTHIQVQQRYKYVLEKLLIDPATAC